MNFHIEYEREEDGRWLAEVPEIPGVLTYGATAEEAPWPRRRPWRCAPWPSASRQAKVAPSQFPSNLPRHDRLAVGKGQVCSGGVVGDWVGNKRQSGSHRTLSRPGWPDYVFAFHEGEKIGPCMLARISKHTGLQPGDL